MSDEEPGRERDTTDPEQGIGHTRLSRLKLLKFGAVGAVGATAGGLALSSEAKAAPPPPLRYLTKWEFALVTAMAEVLWPTDDAGPGARAAGVGNYIDGQLSTGWGMGHRFYMQGPFFQPADSGHGWQVPLVPRDVYRAALGAVDQYSRNKYGQTYVDLTTAQQTAVIEDLRLGRLPIPLSGATTFAGTDFYGMFRQNVLEGMLADPSYGGNRGLVGWKYVGFPGNPMRNNGEYAKLIFTDKAYASQYKPMPMPGTKHDDMKGM